MRTNILWTGRKYHSLENCLVTISNSSSQIDSTIIGYYEGKIYAVDYRIKTNAHWETVYFEVKYRDSTQVRSLIFEGDGKGNWTSDGEKQDQVKDCIDVDISLTPFTNTLPINRLKLAPGQTSEIQVIYLDLPEQEIKPVRQKYTRLSAMEYHYENVPNDFEAKIEVDELGLVVDYPSLFVRTAALNV